MIVYLWNYLWKKTQSSLHYVKIALCVFVVYLLIFSVFARVFQTNKKKLHAKKSTVNSSSQIRALITDKKINSTKEGRIAISLYKGLTCSLIGEACYTDLDKKNPSNASTFIASALVYPFLNPPASGVRATIDTLAQAGFIPQSQAATGVGFSSIRPLMNIWRAMRDVAYLLLVLVIVSIGFMIMFRTKINPQTIVNAENSLPKIIMALIYITFSFAIAGFLIDLMYVVLVLIILILGPEQMARTPQVLMTTFLQASPWKLLQILLNFDFTTIFWNLPVALFSILGGGIGGTLKLIITTIGFFFLHSYVDKALSWMYQPDLPASALVIGINGIARALLRIVATPLGMFLPYILALFLVPFLVGVIIFVTVLMLFFRIFFLLFSGYIKLFVLIIIAPIYLLFEAIPGQSTFSSWIKNIVELLVPFPVIVATFLIGTTIIEASIQGALWTPPFLVGLNPEYLSNIIGVWILFMIPDFIGIVQKAINPKPLPLEAGIGTFFGGAKSGLETGMGEMSKYALLAGSFTPLNRLMRMIPGFKPGGGGAGHGG